VIRPAAAAVIVMRSPSWNIRATLPNKLFEAIGAGVPVVASDLFTLRRIVRRYDLGQCCDPDQPAALADALRRLLTPEAQDHYRAGVCAAQAELNRQSEARKLVAFYTTLLGA
jgi:glycosyltransferase involved in cell wall biosynthesis